MKCRPIRRIWRGTLFTAGCLLALCVVAAGISVATNISAPAALSPTDRLSRADKAVLSEALHLHHTLGNSVWPGWADAETPLMVYNGEHVFLVGYTDPPSGWLKVPQRQARGRPWEVVADDSFEGEPYYHQKLASAKQAPEAFVVLVGERWVGSMQTEEFAETSMVAGLREQLPPLVREIIPYRLLWNEIAGGSDGYITLLLHEAFHAYQGMINPERLAGAEEAMRLEDSYPWDDAFQRAAWQRELDWLVDAATASSDAQAAILAKQFLKERDTRRAQVSMTPELVDFERKREWLEGLAKYAELGIGRAGGTTPGYAPLQDLTADRSFHRYGTRDRFWSLQMDQVRSILGNEGEIRFYYSGFAQAVLLDRLYPGWKERAIAEGTALDALLRQATCEPPQALP